MTCDACSGPSVGSGFFQRIIHERHCEQAKNHRETLIRVGLPMQDERCGKCKENITSQDILCTQCQEEHVAQKKEG